MIQLFYFWYSSAVLESLGDETSNDYRKQMFDDIDRDMDGWITYDEFLEVKFIVGYFINMYLLIILIK